MDVSCCRFPTEHVSALPKNMKTPWLIDKLWLAGGCGIIGGQPKCCKSWLGLDMAVSVASGTPCLGKFSVLSKGPSLVFMAEDRVEEVRNRIENIATQRAINLVDLDIHLITAPVLRLDDDEDCRKLDATLSLLKPTLLLLDPLVRLHRLDENSAKEISGLLGFLRELERKHQVAIVLTHHASKRAHSRPGQGLRGSSDLHAFGDSNIYLSRKSEDLELIVEHRFAAAMEPIALRLVTDGSVHLKILENASKITEVVTLESRIESLLWREPAPISRVLIRQKLRVNNMKLGVTLGELVATGSITLLNGLYSKTQ
jgi:hypothetical protein